MVGRFLFAREKVGLKHDLLHLHTFAYSLGISCLPESLELWAHTVFGPVNSVIASRVGLLPPRRV